MNIRSKLTLRFSVIVASILMLFSLVIYLQSDHYRQEEFYSRLENRALTTVRLLVNVKEIDNSLLQFIDKNSIQRIFEEKVLVFDQRNKLIYNSLDDFPINYSFELLQEIRRKKLLEYTENKREVVGIVYPVPEGELVVLASAYDRYGRSKLANLGRVILAGLILGIGIIILVGRIFAAQAMLPLVKMNAEVANISAGNLNLRVEEGEQRDEITQLAHNFNQMLGRLEAAFAVQRQFVSSASHELRTPLMSMISQLQAILSKNRSQEEYRQVLHSVFEDTRTLVELTNGLLVLAQSGIDQPQATFRPVRLDEMIFSAQTELTKNHPDYHFHISYSELPEDDNALTINGNEQLLKTAFVNLMDNACKFSPDQSVQILVAFPQPGWIEICFSDHGPGVPPAELEKIFTPFYRASNIPPSVRGHGIGLSLSLRIIHLHQGTIRPDSNPGGGARFYVEFPTNAG